MSVFFTKLSCYSFCLAHCTCLLLQTLLQKREIVSVVNSRPGEIRQLCRARQKSTIVRDKEIIMKTLKLIQ